MAGVTRLGERYELRHLVGRGGMGEVWAARDVHGGRDVAVKTATGEVAHLLRQEAALTASVDHPGVVEIHDTGADGATTYLVMDLVRGPDLAQVLDDGPLPAPEGLRVVAGVADALAAAHRAGVVHGDVKPANVVLRGEDVVLVDFGVAAPVADDGGRVTFGTASYMAPEQVASEPLTPATDVYALGCLLSAVVAGRPPFTADSPTVLLQRHARAQPPRLAELVRHVPPRLDALVATMLAKEPAARCTAAQARDALTELRRDPAIERVAPHPGRRRAGRLDPDATVPALVVLEGDGRQLRRAA